MRFHRLIAAALAGVAWCALAVPGMAANAAGSADRTPVPPPLQPPAGSVLKARFAARGVQIYQCQGTQWKLQGPDAQLSDRSGKLRAKHYAGPTWEASDGSKVVAEPVAHADAPGGRGVAWLLLQAKSNSGPGLFGEVRFIQRLHTVGGQAPSAACGAANADQTERVPYTADYYFYTAGTGSRP